MLRTFTVVAALSLASACGGGDPSHAEGQSIKGCVAQVEQRTGQTLGGAEPAWRITSRDEADGYVVNVWTHTPKNAERPTGTPNFVCVTKRDREQKGGIRLVGVRP